MHNFTLLIILSLTLTLNGCGFHLRQANELPQTLSSMTVKCQVPQDANCQKIVSRLSQYITNNQKAVTTLEISTPELTQTAKSIDSKARAAEYELSLAVDVQLIHNASGILLHEKQLQRRQRYRYQEDNILAKERESNELVSKLSQELANDILRQLSPFTDEKIAEITQPSKAP